MRSRQRESRRGVIEARWSPAAGVVTLQTLVRDLRGRVVWRGGTGIVHLMADEAFCRGARELSVNVALLARRREVCAGQWKRRRGVAEARRRPLVRRVAVFACSRNLRRFVIERLRILIVAAVAIETGWGGSGELSLNMALLAGRRKVRSGQCERGFLVMETGRPPRRGSVTFFAAA